MNYKICTLDEMVAHVECNTTQAITQQLMYYQKNGNIDVVVKIQKARILIKQKKLALEMGSL